MTLTVPAGKTQFTIKNNSMRALEWEILKGVLVVEERENIAPGFIQKMTVDLQPGETKTVTFKVKASDLAFVGYDGKWILEKGDFRIQTGDQTVNVVCTDTKKWETPNK